MKQIEKTKDTVLISIKPQYAQKIFEGSKKFEFRKSIFKSMDVTKIIVYASTPIQKVIGEFQIDYILNLNINALWKKTYKHSGITEDFFFQYFDNKKSGYAIRIKNTRRYRKPLNIQKAFNTSAPQSFIYVGRPS